MKRTFKTQARVAFADTDAMGVVYHANYLRWFENGRTELLREIGFPYTELEKWPIWMPLAHASMDYKKSARYDDLIEIVTRFSEVGHASLVLYYEIFNKETGELLVTGTTRHGITDDKLKPIAIKKVYPGFYAVLKEALGDG